MKPLIDYAVHNAKIRLRESKRKKLCMAETIVEEESKL
jgi:hypothetical protein